MNLYIVKHIVYLRNGRNALMYCEMIFFLYRPTAERKPIFFARTKILTSRRNHNSGIHSLKASVVSSPFLFTHVVCKFMKFNDLNEKYLFHLYWNKYRTIWRTETHYLYRVHVRIIKLCVKATPSTYSLMLEKGVGIEGCEIFPHVKLISVRTELGKVLSPSQTTRLSNFSFNITDINCLTRVQQEEKLCTLWNCVKVQKG